MALDFITGQSGLLSPEFNWTGIDWAVEPPLFSSATATTSIDPGQTITINFPSVEEKIQKYEAGEVSLVDTIESIGMSDIKEAFEAKHQPVKYLKKKNYKPKNRFELLDFD